MLQVHNGKSHPVWQ